MKPQINRVSVPNARWTSKKLNRKLKFIPAPCMPMKAQINRASVPNVRWTSKKKRMIIPATNINTIKTIKMIKTSITALVIVAITFTACQDTNTKDEHAGYDMSADTTQPVASADEKTVKEIAVIYTTVDSKAAASLKESVDHYLHIKNALANDNSTEAAAGGKAMEAGLSKMDKSLLTAEQKMAYDKLEEG
jgi:hypothetical protein